MSKQISSPSNTTLPTSWVGKVYPLQLELTSNVTVLYICMFFKSAVFLNLDAGCILRVDEAVLLGGGGVKGKDHSNICRHWNSQIKIYRNMNMY